MSMSVRLLSLTLIAGLAAVPATAGSALVLQDTMQGTVPPTPPAPPAPPEPVRPPRAPRAPRAQEPANAAPQSQPPVQARPGGPESNTPQTDQTVDVVKGTRLVLSNQAGEVTVRAWDRDAVRVQANHNARERVDVQTADNALRIRGRASRGPSGLIDFTLTVPRWMPVNLSGSYLAATIEGTSAEVNVETVGGDITVRGGSGAVTLRSIEGEIGVDGATGKLQATTVNDSIALNNVTGDVVAETTNGDVTISASRAASLEISTVNGDVRFEGPIADKGIYRVSTHNGDIQVSLGQQANATVFIRTFGGDFSSDFPITLPEGVSARSGNKRFNFTLGGGNARVELESFQGDIRVMRGPLPARRGRRGAQLAPMFPSGLPLRGLADGAIDTALETALDSVKSLKGLDNQIEREVEQSIQRSLDTLRDIPMFVAPSGRPGPLVPPPLAPFVPVPMPEIGPPSVLSPVTPLPPPVPLLPRVPPPAFTPLPPPRP
jgi:DUF4097 and DUF4098 domain-containing protein YvlB